MNLRLMHAFLCSLMRACTALSVFFLLCWGLTTRQPLRVILCRLPEKGRKEIEERVEETKEKDRRKEEQE